MSLRNPVRYPVKYYSWQDSQAPQLTDADGVIKTILKACLVTGYGSKAGAGWTALFEDAYRIVLRRPLRTGNPPDIKIENGTITGTTIRHRIVAQDNPASLDDATELSAVNLLARDSKCGKEWHLVVTDFGFILCYQMGESASTTARNGVLFVGGCKKLVNADSEYFLATTSKNINANGTGGTWLFGLMAADASNNPNNVIDMRRKVGYTNKNVINFAVAEKYFDNDYLAQKIIIDKVAELPFFCAVTNKFDDLITSQISINMRPMLRYVNKYYLDYGAWALYIPLDYWEL